jgi:hypothetical protein
MMGTGADVAHTVLFHLPLKPRLAAPVGVLAAVDADVKMYQKSE